MGEMKFPSEYIIHSIVYINDDSRDIYLHDSLNKDLFNGGDSIIVGAKEASDFNVGDLVEIIIRKVKA